MWGLWWWKVRTRFHGWFACNPILFICFSGNRTLLEKGLAVSFALFKRTGMRIRAGFWILTRILEHNKTVPTNRNGSSIRQNFDGFTQQAHGNEARFAKKIRKWRNQNFLVGFGLWIHPKSGCTMPNLLASRHQVETGQYFQLQPPKRSGDPTSVFEISGPGTGQVGF